MEFAERHQRCSTGFRNLRAQLSVSLDPPWRLRRIEKTTVASLSRIFPWVLCEYPRLGVSFKLYFFSITPSSARRPFGHQPPWGILWAIAKSNAMRSAPVCPPEMILAANVARFLVGIRFTMVFVSLNFSLLDPNLSFGQ